MSDLAKTIASLTPEQRVLFNLRLKQRRPSLLKLQPIPRRQGDGPWPLSFEQERLWFVQELFPEGAAYNINNDAWFGGPLNVAALAASLTEMVRRHEILRTSFVLVDGRPRQVVHAAAPPHLPLVDLSGLPAAAGRAELRRGMVARARQPFDLAGRPLRVTLFRAAGERWVLLTSIHHIATDWWSFNIYQKDVATLYADFSRGRPPSLPELPVQFADFALWQREWLPDEVRERGLLDYWKGRLAGAPESVELGDRPRPAVGRFQGRRRPFLLAPGLADRLKALGRREDVTPFAVFLAAYAALLHRWSQADDLLVGTPVADRGRPETEPLIGYFLNLLILRLRVAGGLPFRRLLEEVRDVVHGAYAHQELPYGMLLDELRPARSLNRMPLFQLAFVYVMVPGAGEEPRPAATAAAGEAEPPMFDPGTSRVDLTFVVEDLPQGLQCFFEYSSELFDASTLLRMSGHLETLLAAVAGDAGNAGNAGDGADISGLPLLSTSERAALLFEWNDSAADLGAAASRRVPELVREQAERTPDAVAVACGSERLTYRELDGRARRLARLLRRRGVGPETRVAVALERSVHTVAALLGVLAAGGAYVPVDPETPRARLLVLLEESAAGLLLTESSLAAEALSHLPAELPAGGPPVILLDRVWDEVLSLDPLPPDDADPRHLAYVVFTSGSTGRPKGIEVPHAALSHFLAAARQVLGFTALDRFLGVSSLSFDMSVPDLFLPLVCGGSAELARREELADGPLLAARLAGSGATVMQATPATWQMLVEAGWPGSPGLRAFCGGEAWPRELAGELRARTGELWNIYGPTETTVWVAAGRVGEGSGPLPLGRPIAGARLHLLGRDLRPVPLGAAGEICIGGPGVARGYGGRPDLNAESFVPDPFAPPDAAGARLYKSGDLARRRGDGEIEFLGRADLQVKVRGFRIEVGEIEAVLARHPRVRQVAVAARGEGASRQLVAYVVAATLEEAPKTGELRRFAGESLPPFMVPSVVVPLAALPLTAGRKLDRRALPEPGVHRPDLESAWRAPGNELERLVAACWQEVLGLDRVGVDDNFFDAGGNSLLLLRLRLLVGERLGRDLPLSVFFRSATVAALAAELGGGGEAVSPPEEGAARGGVRREADEERALWRERRRAARESR